MVYADRNRILADFVHGETFFATGVMESDHRYPESLVRNQNSTCVEWGSDGVKNQCRKYSTSLYAVVMGISSDLCYR